VLITLIQLEHGVHFISDIANRCQTGNRLALKEAPVISAQPKVPIWLIWLQSYSSFACVDAFAERTLLVIAFSMARELGSEFRQAPVSVIVVRIVGDPLSQ